MNNLEPCPFCGCPNIFCKVGTNRRSQIYTCGDCGCQLETNEKGTSQDCQWNQRVTKEN